MKKPSRTAAATSILFAIYVIVFALLWISSGVPDLPSDLPSNDLNFSQAYWDIHEIASRPHPYNSHANDVVRSYLLERLKNITHGHLHITVEEDLTSTATWVRGSEASNFEGLNVLVKVDGTEEGFREKGGVLFSAHYDSVSTAPGVTDNTIGIASMLAFVEYLTIHRVKRTAIFNFNNGEEDGLKGAHVFLEHPWSKIPDTFLNLEGAGAGGRPMLFRSTSLSPVRHYTSPAPHGTVISADAFSRGVVRSGTDYAVYAHGLGNKSMEGIDIAFYQRRSSYHTLHDSIRGADGARESLWAMMTIVKSTGLAMLNDERLEEEIDAVDPVYFDLFGKWFIMLTQQTLLKFSITIMVLGLPTALALIVRETRTSGLTPRSARGVPMFGPLFSRQGFSFVSSLLLSTLAQALLVFTILKCNPCVVHSHPYTLLISTFSLSYLTTIPFLGSMGTSRQALGTELYSFTYILNGIATYALYRLRIGGVFFIIGWHFCAWLGCAVGLLDSEVERAGGVEGVTPNKKNKKKKRHSHSAELSSSQTRELRIARPWWFLQALVSIPVPVIMMSQILFTFLTALGQTLTDGSSPVFVYAATSLLSFFIVLPLSPFSASIHSCITSYVLAAFIMSATFNLTTFPFTTDAPLKVFFQQRVQLLPDGGAKALTALTGVPYYLDKFVVPQLPSSWGRNMSCAMDEVRTRTWTCVWESNLFPSPGSTNDLADTATSDVYAYPLSSNVDILGPNSALIHLAGLNTRSCKLYFDNRNVTGYDVYDLSPAGDLMPAEREPQSGFGVPSQGASSLRMYSRSWNRKFAVKLHWGTEKAEDESAHGLKGRIACEWSEYASAMKGTLWHGHDSGGRIPAFEEVLEYLPRWAAVTKLTDGLVEVWSEFET